MIDPDQIEGKAELFVDFEDGLNIFDAPRKQRAFPDFCWKIWPWQRGRC